jgi:diphthamide biosynthesis protein 2
LSLSNSYFLIQKVKDANVIGILVGTLGVQSYLSMIEQLRQLITHAGKKCYVFAMGKLNVAKLANFMEVDAYVLVACPENTMVDAKEFYRPVVTPFELRMGTVRGMQWTGDYVTDFRVLQQGVWGHVLQRHSL